MVTNESPLKYLFRPEEIELLICGSRVRGRGLAWRGCGAGAEGAELCFLETCRTWISRRWRKPRSMTGATPGTRL